MPIKIKNKEAVKISGIYFLVSFLYILFSDKLLLLFTKDAQIISKIQTYKGLGFVFVSSAIIYYLVHSELKIKKRVLKDLKKKNEEHEALNEEYIKLNEELNERNNNLNILNEKLKISKEKYASLFNNINDGIILHEISDEGFPGKIIEVNDAACKQLKYSREELLEKTIMDINTSCTTEIALEIVNKIRGEKKIIFNAQLVDKENQTINFEVNSHYFFLEGKEVTLSITRNIEERIRTENELRKSKELIEESRLRYKTITEASQDGIFIYSSVDKVEYVNPAACKLHGYSKEEMLNMQPKEFIHPDTYSVFLDFIDTIDKGKEFHGEASGITKAGNKFHVKIFGCSIYMNGAKKYFSIVHDITEQKIYESEIITAKERAEQADNLKSMFLMNMSHEIRTPMNGILGFTDLLEKENLSSESKLKYINIIRSSGKQLLRVINDIIDISKIETNQYNVIKKPFSLNELIDEVGELLKTKIGNKPIEVKFKKGLSDEKSILLSDKERLFQVLSNLANNAEKFTKSGSIEIKYILKNNTTLEFQVSDTGIGIPEDKLSVIFERFIQVEDAISRNYGGTGLGLSIAKGIIEKLGGDIKVISDFGKGSAFIFTLPYIRC